MKMKPFNLEKAKAGHPVCIRKGNNARIIYFDAKNAYPIIALIENEDDENVICYNLNGNYLLDGEHPFDLFMKCEKKKKPKPNCKGWINIYKGKSIDCSEYIYDSKEEAKQNKYASGYITTIKIKWFDPDKKDC